MLLKERSGRCELKNRVEELEARCRSLTQQGEQARSGEEQHKAALHRLEESISQGESLRAQQQAEEVQLYGGPVETQCKQQKKQQQNKQQQKTHFKNKKKSKRMCGACELLQMSSN